MKACVGEYELDCLAPSVIVRVIERDMGNLVTPRVKYEAHIGDVVKGFGDIREGDRVVCRRWHMFQDRGVRYAVARIEDVVAKIEGQDSGPF